MIFFPSVEFSPRFREDFCPCRRRPTFRRKNQDQFSLLHQMELLQPFLDMFLTEKASSSKCAESCQKKTEESKEDYLCIPVRICGYKPEEVTVKINDGSVTIHGKHENASEGAFESREFRREFAIPAEVDPETIEARMDRSGLLSIRGKPKLSEEPRMIELKKSENSSLEEEKNSRETESENSVLETEHQKADEMVPPVAKEGFIKFETTGFAPEELSVKIADGKVLVQAKHEESDSGSFVSRELRREFAIPVDVDADSIVAEINEDGVLCVLGSPNIPEEKKTVSAENKKEVSLKISVRVPEKETGELEKPEQ